MVSRLCHRHHPSCSTRGSSRLEDFQIIGVDFARAWAAFDIEVELLAPLERVKACQLHRAGVDANLTFASIGPDQTTLAVEGYYRTARHNIPLWKRRATRESIPLACLL